MITFFRANTPLQAERYAVIRREATSGQEILVSESLAMTAEDCLKHAEDEERTLPSYTAKYPFVRVSRVEIREVEE